jgi:hypothetical protein
MLLSTATLPLLLPVFQAELNVVTTIAKSLKVVVEGTAGRGKGKDASTSLRLDPVHLRRYLDL